MRSGVACGNHWSHGTPQNLRRMVTFLSFVEDFKPLVPGYLVWIHSTFFRPSLSIVVVREKRNKTKQTNHDNNKNKPRAPSYFPPQPLKHFTHGDPSLISRHLGKRQIAIPVYLQHTASITGSNQFAPVSPFCLRICSAYTAMCAADGQGRVTSERERAYWFLQTFQCSSPAFLKTLTRFIHGLNG